MEFRFGILGGVLKINLHRIPGIVVCIYSRRTNVMYYRIKERIKVALYNQGCRSDLTSLVVFVLGRWYRLFPRLSNPHAWFAVHFQVEYLQDIKSIREQKVISLWCSIDVDDYDASGPLPRLCLARTRGAPLQNRLSLAESGTTENLHAASTLK